MNKELHIFDCTMRDGANVVGKGFDAELTKMMLKGLIACGITTIEMGNALGLGAYEANKSIAPLTDEEYLKLIQPFLPQAEIGMFMGYKNATPENIALAKQYGLKFLRIGANASDGEGACAGIKLVKAAGLKCYYSIMKAYVLSPEDLAQEAKLLEASGLDAITIMDSAGTMTPEDAEAYASALVKAIKIPVAFHGHNNLGLSVANAMAAQKGGATIFDTGLLGMARSAGNCATELLVAVFQKMGYLPSVDLYKLLDFLDAELIPAMEKHNYHVAVKPIDLIFGLAGAHSSFTKMFVDTAKAKNVPLYKLIVEVSKLNRKNPSQDLVNQVADKMQK